jgi:general secretion pathway protein M
MMEQVKAWFATRAPRERWLLAIASVLAAAVIAVYGLLFPSIAALGSAEKELYAAIEQRGRMETKVASLTKPTSESAPSPLAAGQSLQALIKSSAEAAGLEIAEVTANGPGRATFRMASVKAGALLAWISRMETQGIELTNLQLRKIEGGFVSADVELAAR